MLLPLGGQHAEELVVLDVVGIVHVGANVVDHAIDLAVKKRVGGECRGLDLPVREQVEFVFGARVDHGDLERAGRLVGHIDRKFVRELRKAVAPLNTALERGGHRLGRDILGEIGRVQTAHDAVADLHADDDQDDRRANDDGRAVDGLSHIGTRWVVGRERVHVLAVRLAVLARELLERFGASLNLDLGRVAQTLGARGSELGIHKTRGIDLRKELRHFLGSELRFFGHI